jgi:macrolide transport system ATP-binding/permease protein
MATRREWINRLRYLGRRSRFEGDLDDEIRFHIENRAEELQGSGVTRDDALAQAQREFGSVIRVREDSREAWQFRSIEDLAADVRYALRAFRRSPGFTLTAVLSLALGIGANSAIFTAMDAVLWKPLPVANPQSLVLLSATREGRRNIGAFELAFANRLQRARVFSDIVVIDSDGLSFSAGDRAERIVGQTVSTNFFDFLGVPLTLGRGFTRSVDAGPWVPEVVLSYRFWQRRFGGEPGVIGRVVHINTYPFTVVGVSAASFFDLEQGFDPEVRVPRMPLGQELSQIEEVSGSPSGHHVLMARLKPGTSLATAEAAADAQFQEYLRISSHPRIRGQRFRNLHLLPGGRGWEGNLAQFHASLFVLLALVAVVLLIACANVANMLLARAAGRGREIAIRASIGAGRFRLVRQMLTESVLLSMLGGAVGIAVAVWASGLLLHFLPQGHMSLVLNLQPDRRALLFTFLLSLLTGLLFGLVPALQATRGDVPAMLKSDSAASIGERGNAGFRRILVICQVAFSLTLLIAAGTFVRTLSDLRPLDYHAGPDRVLLFTMKPQQEIYTDDRKRLIAAELVRRVSEIPGVARAALAENGPLGSRSSSDWVQLPGHDPVQAEIDWITPGFFDTLGVPRIAGRDFRTSDKPGAPPVTILNQSLAHALFKSENPVGQSLLFSPGKIRPIRFEIVGVMADTHYYSVHKSPQPAAWFTFQESAPYMPTLHVRMNTSSGDATVAAVRHEFDLLDKGFPVFDIKTLERRIEASLARERMVASLSAAFGVLALALAAVGLYGVLAYSVSRRTREIGIRMALGARSGLVLWLVAREALLLVGAGSVAGVAMAAAASRILSQYLAGVSPTGPMILIACTGAMWIIGAVAVSVPAIRACRVDPLSALRHE